MSIVTEETPRKSHWLAWTFGIIAALPVLYVLTLPWLLMLAVKLSPYHTLDLFWAGYCNPYEWLALNIPHGDVLRDYNVWCFRLMGYTISPASP